MHSQTRRDKGQALTLSREKLCSADTAGGPHRIKVELREKGGKGGVAELMLYGQSGSQCCVRAIRNVEMRGISR